MHTDAFKDIEQIVPHRSPMVMIDSYTRIDQDTARSEKQFSPDSYGVSEGFVLESILIESLAQTVAAHSGYQSMGDVADEPGMGMLTSVDLFEVYEKVRDSALIEVRLEKTDEVGPFKIITGEVRVENRLMAKGRIKVYEPGAGGEK